MAKTKEQLLNILDQFQLDEKVVSAEPFGNGHINDTLKVTNEKGEIKYVLQRINHLIFTNVDMLQITSMWLPLISAKAGGKR